MTSLGLQIICGATPLLKTETLAIDGSYLTLYASPSRNPQSSDFSVRVEMSIFEYGGFFCAWGRHNRSTRGERVMYLISFVFTGRTRSLPILLFFFPFVVVQGRFNDSVGVVTVMFVGAIVCAWICRRRLLPMMRSEERMVRTSLSCSNNVMFQRCMLGSAIVREVNPCT